MDRNIERTGLGKRNRWLVILAVVAALAAGFYVFASAQAFGRSQTLPAKSLNLARVSRGRFDEKLNVRGILSAKTTIYLDAVAGGIVEEKLVDKGAYLKKGQPLLRLSNMTLQLEVISREAQVSEQLNLLRNNELLAETSRLQLRTDILENENQIAHLQHKVRQVQPLAARGLLPEAQLTDLQQDLEYYRNRDKIALERQRQEEAIRARQQTQLQASAKMLQENLDQSRSVLDNLLVKAPTDGYLSEWAAELGESKPAGARLGRIDVPGGFKLVASVDEYYINRVSVGIPANIAIDSRTYSAAVTKIDSRVSDGKFTVEVELPQDVPTKALKVGEGIDLDLIIGGTHNDALMVDRGPFLNDTGGNWIFLVSSDGKKATRRSIRLGARNRDHYEVLSGLSAGDLVVISSYGSFDKADTLYLN